MALRQRGDYRYGDSQTDIREELTNFSRANGYLATHFADAVCVCGSRVFNVPIDEEEGVAVRVCVRCKTRHEIGDSAEYIADASLEECACPCGGENFEVTAGVSLYQNSEDVRWFYLGLRCASCSLTACYGEWKNEYAGFEGLLKKI